MSYLLVSPSRSSIAGHLKVSQEQDLTELQKRYDEEWQETRHLKPWRLAELKPQRDEASAARKAWQVSRQSGFRARLMALRHAEDADAPNAGPPKAWPW